MIIIKELWSLDRNNAKLSSQIVRFALYKKVVLLHAEIRYQITCETQTCKQKNLFRLLLYRKSRKYISKKEVKKEFGKTYTTFLLSKMKKRRMKKKFSEKYINF